MLQKFQYFTDVVKFQAGQIPKQVAYTFNGKGVTYEALWAGVSQYALYFKQAGIQRNEQVLIALPNGSAFLSAFFACQILGAIPIPVAPSSGIQRINKIADLAKATHLISSLDLQLAIDEINAEIKVHTVESVNDAPENELYLPETVPHEIAFIQFTSGTTGEPKGAVITHKNLLINIQQMIGGMEICKEDVFVSWLPTYHDMGLILMALTPIYLGIPTHLLPTSLRDLSLWLKTIETHKATFTAAPDFAYRMLFRYIRQPENYDLSSLRVALNAAEPVRAGTVERFHEAFGLENVMVAGYGLAEATVGVSMWKPRTKNRVDDKGFVSVGLPFPEVDVKIVLDNLAVGQGNHGEIMIKSPANISGYFLQKEADASLFWEGEYIRSGDIGYLDADDFLYIVDRKKNVIKHIGRTIAPKEIEEAVEGFDAVRHATALGIDHKGVEGEQITLFVELRRAKQREIEAYQEMVIDMIQAVSAHMGIRPARVVLLKPGAVPKTHNGKTQYGILKDQFLRGELAARGLILFST